MEEQLYTFQFKCPRNGQWRQSVELNKDEADEAVEAIRRRYGYEWAEDPVPVYLQLVIL